MTFQTAKGGFFDREKVKRSVDAGTRKVLSKFGAFVWKRAKTSLKYRDKPSKPGLPPHVHKTMLRTKVSKKTGVTKIQSVSPLREFIFFAYEPDRKSVVIGPIKFDSKISGVPKVLEYGGTSMIIRRGKETRIRIRPRPFMRPAFEAEKSRLPTLWRDSVH